MALGLRPVRVLVFLALAGAFTVLALGEPASGATSCRQQVIDDWSDNGRVDRVYGLDCYQAAIGSLPPDIRDYTDAHDSIERALSIAVRAKSGPPSAGASRSLAATPAVATSGTGEIPLSLIALAGLAAGTLAAGALGYTSRRAARGHRGAAR
jgi:hypothetical protein